MVFLSTVSVPKIEIAIKIKIISTTNILRNFPFDDNNGRSPPAIPAYAVFERLKIEIGNIMILINQPTGKRRVRKKYGVERNCSFNKVLQENIEYPNLNEFIITFTIISKRA